MITSEHEIVMSYGGDGKKVEPGSEGVVARSRTFEGHTRFFILRSRRGSMRGHLYDPQTVLEEERDRHLATEGEYQMAEVSEECFRHYLTYLRTREMVEYRLAEREG